MEWLQTHLENALRWHLANPGRENDPDAPEIIPAGMRIWSIFLDLNAARTTGFVPNPISSTEIEAYARLHRTPIRLFELAIIRKLDFIYIEFGSRRDPVTQTNQPGPVSSRPMSPGLFDAMFSR